MVLILFSLLLECVHTVTLLYCKFLEGKDDAFILKYIFLPPVQILRMTIYKSKYVCPVVTINAMEITKIEFPIGVRNCGEERLPFYIGKAE